MNTLSEINAALATSTIVERVEFRADLMTGRCSVALELVDDEVDPSCGSPWKSPECLE